MDLNLIMYPLFLVLSLIVVVSIISFKMGRRSIIAKPDFCFLCSTHRDNVEFMIAGNSGALCTGCMRYGLAWLDNNKLNELKVPRNLLLSLVDFLSFSEKSLDKTIRESIFFVLQKISGVNITIFRDVLNRALVNKQAKLVLSLLRALPPDQWQDSDHVNWLWSNIVLHKFEDALNPLPGIPEIKDSISGYLFVMNRILARLNIDPLPPTDEIKDNLAKLFYLNDAFEKSTEPTKEHRNYYLGVLHSIIAECYYRIEKFDKSEKHLNIALDFKGEEDIENIILRGDIAKAAGNRKEASKFLGKALELATDDDVINEKIRKKINGINS
jgi:tetratricopeptide (TPR) repeat protein